MNGTFVHRVEIVGRVEFPVPLEAQPRDVFLYALHILDILFLGVGVVETEIALAAEFSLDAEVYAQRLGVPYVEIPVGFGGETRDNLGMLAASEVVGDDVLDEIGRLDGCDALGCDCVVLLVLHRILP